jgi:hypothetical protein
MVVGVAAIGLESPAAPLLCPSSASSEEHERAGAFGSVQLGRDKFFLRQYKIFKYKVFGPFVWLFRAPCCWTSIGGGGQAAQVESTKCLFGTPISIRQPGRR